MSPDASVETREGTMTERNQLTAEQLERQVNQILAETTRTVTTTGGGPHPTRETLDRELREIKDHVLRMGSMVEEAIRDAITALVDHDADAALAVIEGDGRINEAQRAVTSLITATIATQQPVARDLRFLLTIDHVSYELERMGDHAGSVA